MYSTVFKLIFCLLFVGSSRQFSLKNPFTLGDTKRLFQRPISEGDVGEPLFLTPLIEDGKIAEAQNLSFVPLPIDWVTSYSGFLTVDKPTNSNMFFWYFEAASDPENAPVLIWLQGGPGASSLFGLFTENGPFNIDAEANIVRRKYSWHLNHHLIYIDNPVGTGFSFTEHDTGYVTDETEVGANLYETLRQFYLLFPNLQKNHLFLSGESYGGKYVPALGYTIHLRNNEANASMVMNLAGLAIGNGWCDPIHQQQLGDYFYQLGLIDNTTLQIFHDYEARGVKLLEQGEYLKAFYLFDQLIGGDITPSVFQNASKIDFPYNFLALRPPTNNLAELVTNADWRRAIHVGNLTFNSNDDAASNLVAQYLLMDVQQSIAPWIEVLLDNYHTVFYNGQLDLVCPYPPETSHLSHLKFAASQEYASAERFVWRVDGEVAGYAKEAGNLVEVLVRNSGHMVPTDNPKWAYDIILRLTQNKSFRK